MLIPFSTIIGQQWAINFLTSSFNKDKLGHAYLLKGPSGVGKKMVAHAFAALINCAHPQDIEVCGHCPSCKKFASGNHPDLLVIEPEGAGIKIKQIRALQQQLTFPPFEAKSRLVLLADIHETMRRPEVANALLKTLEEPPKHTLLILSGNESGTILPTILSRCQIIPLIPLPLAEVSRMLMNDDAELAEKQAMTYAAISEGSLGRARTLQKKNLLPLRRTIIEQLTILPEDCTETVQQVFPMAAEAAALKENLDDFLNLLTTWLRDVLVLRSGAGSHPISHDLGDLLEQGSRCWSQHALQNKLHSLDQARRQLARHCNRTLVLEVLFFALLAEKC